MAPRKKSATPHAPALATAHEDDINRNEVVVDTSSEEAEAESIVARAKNQASKIIERANIKAQQIIDSAVAEAGSSEISHQPNDKAWYYGPDGQADIFQVGKQPEGWYDNPDEAAEADK